MAGRRYYEPSRHGLEARVTERAERIRAILGQAEDGAGDKPKDRPGSKTESPASRTLMPAGTSSNARSATMRPPPM